MAEQVRNQSVEPQKRHALTSVPWETVSEPGTYIEAGTGDMYRIPQATGTSVTSFARRPEALIAGGSPIIRKESAGASRLIQVSKNPFLTTLQARMLSAEHNVEPNF
jgi:hypothetical protein